MERYTLNRIGLYNYWYYDYEEFYFKEGKLFLRGGNGAGKSVTMQTFITFLLDGNKQPHRLDPFETRDRKMKDLLLGEKKISKIEDRIGYVFMEFVKPKTKQFITVGYGLEARKDKAELHDDWGFIIHNSFTRIGKGEKQFKLYYEEKVDGEIREFPLSKSELKKELGEHGIVTETRGEYLKKVNQYLFGFPTEEYLKKYTELLVQLKSPKLSKEFNPDTVCDILTHSLAALTRTELEPLTESVENMNQIEEDIQVLRRDINSIKQINERYDKYNEVKLYEIISKYIEAHQNTETKKNKKQDNEIMLEQKNTDHANLEEEIKKNEVLEFKYREEETSLRQHEIHGIKSKLIQVKENIKQETERLKTKEHQLGMKDLRVKETKRKLDALESDASELNKNIKDVLLDMEYDAELSKFNLQHENYSTHFKREFQTLSFDFALWKSEAKEYKNKISSLLVLLREHERILERLKQIRIKVENKNEILTNERNKLSELEIHCEEARGDLEEDVIDWMQELVLLELDHEEKEELIRMVNRVFISEPGGLYQTYVSERVLKKQEIILQSKIRLENEHEKLTEAREQKLVDLKRIEETEEIEPEWHDDKVKSIKELKKQNVPFLPFYEAVEFKNNISEENRNKIESVVVESGLLTAVIVPENYEWLVEQKLVILRKGNPKTKSLLSYLEPSGNHKVLSSDIEEVLASISIEQDDNDNYILPDGRYQNGFVKGVSSNYGEAKYIGKMARETERKRKIEALLFDIQSIDEVIVRLLEDIEEVKQQEAMLSKEHSSFPGLTELQEATHLYESKKRFIEVSLRPEIESLEEDENNKKSEVDESMRKIKARTDFIELALEKDVFERAETQMSEYLERLNQISSDYRILVITMESIQNKAEQKETLEEEADDLSAEVSDIKTAKAKLDEEGESLETQLKLKNLVEVEERIQFVVEEINRLPKEREELMDKRSSVAGELKILKEEIMSMNETLVFDEQLVEMWKERFMNEYHLNYVLVESSKQEPIELAKDLVPQLEGIIGESKKQDEELERYRDRVESSFETVMSNELANLNEYNLSRSIDTMYEGEIPDPMNGLQEAQLEIFKNMKNRYKVILEYEKINRSSYDVKRKLEQHLEVSEEALTQKERALFEEELIAHIGGIIRERIHDAERWINDINEFMKKTSETTNILYQIRWVANRSDTEGEMNTKPLVDALKKDPEILTPKEKEKVARHFRVKIKKAIQDGEYTEKTLYDVMKEELDYRKWYTFQMYWQRKGEGEENLTRLGTTQFNQSSGGEKALTMYTPLLSAVHSRLTEASDDAPRIISLDEAFAGVDEEKIEGMFKLVEDLDFDYIMNSQFLWGTYKTVSALSIIDLNRPGNVPYVHAEKYEWDGKNKVYLGDLGKEEHNGSKEVQSALQLG